MTKFSEKWYARYDKLGTMVRAEQDAGKDPEEMLGKLYREWKRMEEDIERKFYM